MIIAGIIITTLASLIFLLMIIAGIIIDDRKVI